jgi:hypothetical protein
MTAAEVLRKLSRADEKEFDVCPTGTPATFSSLCDGDTDGEGHCGQCD